MGLFSFIKKKFSHEAKSSDSLLTYDKGLDKAKKSFTDKIQKIGEGNAPIPSNYFDELEEILIEADVGASLTMKIINELAEQIKKEKIMTLEAANEALIDTMFRDYAPSTSDNEITFNHHPEVLLVVGVNGVGKTTTIAKLANRYLKQGKSVVLGAADTFRAGAVEQLKEWGNRLKIDVVTGAMNADPASVAYNATKLAKEKNADLLIIDTAGRLQTKMNLMNELSKIARVIAKDIPDAPHETFLILDATTGQNGVIQAKAFNEATKISGAVITKMDGTSKGGILLAIKHELNIPVRFIGLGEGIDDLMPFDLEKYLHGLCVGK
ncbi:MAG: signal recognition particle-docking protein FtsY [Bacilli bacterium]|nr:signal recognition particle-docking protein FtsY [Bacilli bacterium]